jgi:hypothetical protein
VQLLLLPLLPVISLRLLLLLLALLVWLVLRVVLSAFGVYRRRKNDNDQVTLFELPLRKQQHCTPQADGESLVLVIVLIEDGGLSLVIDLRCHLKVLAKIILRAPSHGRGPRQSLQMLGQVEHAVELLC